MHEIYNNTFSTQNDKKWQVGIYVRLSREDEKDERYKGQSESIENQIKYLKNFLENKKWNLIDTYIDDGYTGTNFDRPNFKRLIEDIEKRKINLVVTKDLSRLGRDYIETGRYIEKYFPSKNIRYIAVNDNIDTFDKKNNNNDMTPFKSVINDMYAKDISNKVRSAILTKAIEGECIKAFLPYGYKKDKSNKKNILIDEEVADNIRLIFELYKEGKSKKQIADYLNSLSIKTPLQYKCENTNYFNPNMNNTYRWNSTVINKILRDKIYVGDLVQLKYTKVNYKIKNIIKVPEKEQIVILNNHANIIDRLTFETVQEMLNKKTNEWNYSERKKHLLTGIVFCKCGSRITYNKNHGKYFRCVCSSYKKYGKKFCSNIHLKEDELIEIVLASLKDNIKKYLELNKLEYIKEKSNLNEELKSKREIIEKKKEELQKIIANIYEDKILGIISIDTFKTLIKKYEKQKREYEIKLERLKKEKKIRNCETNINKENIRAKIEEILAFDEINEYTKSLIFKLIDTIIINDKEICIKFKFNISKK